jgi:hypothetical protein
MLDQPRTTANKAALRYLEASGARAISITEGCDHVVLHVAYLPDAAAILWLPADKARAVAARARKIAGGHPRLDFMISSLQKAATERRVTLTDNDTAIARAGAATAQLDAMFAQLASAGHLTAFNQQFKLRREQAEAQGRGFMTYKVAMGRLRRVLLQILCNDSKPVIDQSLFAAIFDGIVL